MKDVLWRYAWIGAGSALGGIGRYYLSGVVAQRVGETFPWGTMFVNVTGCLAIGYFATITGTQGRLLVPSLVRQFFMIGVFGGYTTFSSFSLQTLNLAREGRLVEAAANAALALVLCMAAVWLGHTLAFTLNEARGWLMEIPRDSLLLRIFVGENDHHGHHPLYEAIVLKARELHLAGGTVLRGPMGFGKSSRLHTAKILRLSEDLPMIVEIVDSEERIQSFLPHLDAMMSSGLVTIEKVKVIQYGKPTE